MCQCGDCGFPINYRATTQNKVSGNESDPNKQRQDNETIGERT